MSQMTQSDDGQIQTAETMMANSDLGRLTSRVKGAIENEDYDRALNLTEDVARKVRQDLDKAPVSTFNVCHSLHAAQRIAKRGKAKGDVTEDRAENCLEELQDAHNRL